MNANFFYLRQGNKGAGSVLKKLDDDDYSKLMDLGIEGAKIWELYKDVCGEDILKLKTLLALLQNDPSTTHPIARLGGRTQPVMKYLNL